MNVPLDLEIDEDDQTATHLSVTHQNKVIGTMRVVIKGNHAKFGRVVIHTDYRRKGIGSQMMQQAIDYCASLSIHKVTLGSQTYITNFYELLGFKQQGHVFDDAGIPHIKMIMELPLERLNAR